jgi:hypothetical protein
VQVPRSCFVKNHLRLETSQSKLFLKYRSYHSENSKKQYAKMTAPNQAPFAFSCQERSISEVNQARDLSLSTLYRSVSRNGAKIHSPGSSGRRSTLLPPSAMALMGGSRRSSSGETRVQHLSSVLDRALASLEEYENDGTIGTNDGDASSDQRMQP